MLTSLQGRRLALAVLALAACSDSTAPPDSAHPLTTTVAAGSATELKRTLASIRAATAAFHDVTVALAAGYRQGSPCESRAEGGMGFHYSNRVLMGIVPGTVPIRGTDAVIDPERPELLLYEPTEEGGRRLVGVEYLVFAAAWDAVHDDPPTLAGVPFTLMSGADAHGFAPHYELHVWVWRHNPEGLFTTWNPKVSCG